MSPGWTACSVTVLALIFTNIACISAEESKVVENSQWTRADFAGAKPIELNITDAFQGYGRRSALPESIAADGYEGELAPTTTTLSKALFNIDIWQRTPYLKRSVSPRGPYTSSRVFPDSSNLSYPYRAVVKVFFKNSKGSGFTCSGALIKRGVVLTAGHCVHPGAGGPSMWHNSFVVIPAYKDGYGAYGSANGAQIYAPNSWLTSGGGVPHPADLGLIVLSPGSDGALIGSAVGWLGYRTESAANNHVHQLGFPVNLDGGNRMHLVASVTSGERLPTRTIEAPSDMSSGISGGPWIQNLGQLAEGQLDDAANRLVCVSSYGATDWQEYQYLGCSQLSTEFLQLLDRVCADFPLACA